MEITYLPADETDIAPILAQSRALIERYEDLVSIDRKEVFAWMARKTQKRIGEYRRILCNGETAGWVRVCGEGERTELDDLYVLPAFRDRGVGTAVLRRCLACGKPVFFYVFTQNTRAVALYEREGFRKIETVSPTRCLMAQ